MNAEKHSHKKEHWYLTEFVRVATLSRVSYPVYFNAGDKGNIKGVKKEFELIDCSKEMLYDNV